MSISNTLFNGNHFLNNDFSQPIVTYNSFTNLGTNSDSIPNWIYYTDNLNDIVKISNDNTSVQNKQYLSVNTNYSYISQKILLNENIEYAITLYLKANEPSFSNSKKSQVIVKMNDNIIAIFELTNIWQLYNFNFTTGYAGYHTFQFIFSNQSEKTTFFISNILLYISTSNLTKNSVISNIQTYSTTNYIIDSSLSIDPIANTIPLRDCNGNIYANDIWVSGAIKFYDGNRLPCSQLNTLSNIINSQEDSGSIYTNSIFTKENIYINGDNRYCQNIINITNPINDIMLLRPVTYTTNNKNISGFVAQEVEQIYPNLVKSGQFDNNIQDYLKSVSLVELIPYLVKCIQNQETRIKYLENLIGQ